MNNTIWFINVAFFLTNLFVFTYKILIKVLNRYFPPFQDPSFFAKELFSPEPYEIPLYLSLTFIWVIVIFILYKSSPKNQFTSYKQSPNSKNSKSKLFEKLNIGTPNLFGILVSWKLGFLFFIFLLVIFFINIGEYPLKNNIQFIQSPVDPISSVFILIAYLSLIALIILISRALKKTPIIMVSLVLITVALFTFEPRFPQSTHDAAHFLGPIYELAHKKTIFTTTSSQYGFLSILLLGFLYQVGVFNPFYLPFFTWILYILQYFFSFWIIYKSSRSVVMGLLGLFSILTINYFSLFHLPNTYPQIGPMRWLPFIISLFLVQRFKNPANYKLIFLLSLLSIWNVEVGIALFLAYSLTLMLLFLAGKIGLNMLIKSIGFFIFNIFLFLITINIIHFLLGKPLIDYFTASNRLRDFAVSGIAMIPIPWRTHFWFVLLVYFASIIYFFRQKTREQMAEVKGLPTARRSGDIRRQSSTGGNETSDRIWSKDLQELGSRQNLTHLLFSANLSLFAGIYYIGRSHPHNLFHISIFFLLNTFIFIGLIFAKININKRLSFIFYILFFVFFIVYPAFSRKQAVATMIKTKLDGLKKEQIFIPELENQVKRYYYFDAEMIKENWPEDEILILSVDDTYLFYLTGKKNLLLDNPQSGLAAFKTDIAFALQKAVQSCPVKITATCTLFGCPEYPTLNHEAIDVQKAILESLEKSCKVKYKPVKCTNKLCIISD